jgi:hypothetical protein
MAEMRLGEDFAGRKFDELGGDPPSGAQVTFYLLKVPCDDLIGVASGAREIQPSSSIRREWRRRTARHRLAMNFSSMTIIKAVAVQVVGLMVATGAS